MRFGNLKLAAKQGIGFGLILVIMSGVTIFSVIKMSEFRDEIKRLAGERLPGVIAVSEMYLDTSRYRLSELQLALTYYGYKMREQEQLMLRLRARIKENQDVYEPLISHSEEAETYSEFRGKWDKYLDMHESFMKLSRDSRDEEALKLLNNEARKLFDDMGYELEKLMRVKKKSFHDATLVAENTYGTTHDIIILLIGLTALFSILISLILVRTITGPVRQLEHAAKRVADGHIDVHVDIRTNEEMGTLARSFNQMTEALREVRKDTARQDWFKTGLNELNERMRGDQDPTNLARNIVTYLAKYLDARIAALYIWEEEKEELRLAASYAFTRRKALGNVVRIGEGVVGQAAFEREMISLTQVPEDYIRIASGLGNAPPRNILVCPFMYEDRLVGVVELGMFEEFGDKETEFLRYSAESIAVGIHSAQTAGKIKYLLRESQRQAEELKAQQEELRATNEELSIQRDALEVSEAKLMEQQEELRAANEELEEKARYLEKQKSEISQKNLELEAARGDIEEKAKELEIASKYKSEFLANMSHELRTPLNSMLILARSLAGNEEGNLTEDQARAAQIVYSSGNELLNLINDILDLSKIEAGKMTVNMETVALKDVAENMRMSFEYMIREKGLAFDIVLEESCPGSIRTDQQRLEQIVRNFMSNAIKFTHKGGITLTFRGAKRKECKGRAMAISVKDTGIGIPPEKQADIFEAFQQADGGTSRKYGGTGLGLSISRELSRLLGGEIRMESADGEGSVFTVCLPAEAKSEPRNQHPETSTQKPAPSTPKPETRFRISDDRKKLKPGDKAILIIEDDADFARILLKQCHEKGFGGVVCSTGEEGLEVARTHRPEGVILDIRLPGMDGWTVLEKLKADSEIRDIPVHMMSAGEGHRDALEKGAVGFLAKPVRKEDLESAFRRLEDFMERNIRELLIVEDDDALRESISQLVKKQGMEAKEAANAEQAMDALEKHTFDCMILDLGLPDMTGGELLDMLEDAKDIRVPPVIIHTGKELSRTEEEHLRRHANSIVIKGDKSEERLLDEAALFLHEIVARPSASHPKERKASPCAEASKPASHSKEPSKEAPHSKVANKDSVFENKKILLTDDDMRNVFALSKVLRDKGMSILKAEDGKKALNILDKEPDTDLVLMDIMMPVMDGYEAIRKIREQKRFQKLPVIALTAKAMKGDREKCIAAGASDYMTKPVDLERLLSMMRVWLYEA